MSPEDTQSLAQQDWVAIAAHRLAHRFRHVAPEQLGEVAGELWQNAQLRTMAPAEAVDEWLTPLKTEGLEALPHQHAA